MMYDVAIIGGSLGGVRACLSALEFNKKVVMVESTDWVGGQLTSQAVPPDEHRWIEKFGATKSYLNYRQKVRDIYKAMPNFTDKFAETNDFCPGGSWVSRVAHEPKVALNIFMQELEPFIKNGNLKLLLNHQAVNAKVENDKIVSVDVRNIVTQEITAIFADMFLDATDCGDLLPLANVEYTMGAESKEQTGEIHASEVADPLDMQPITYVVALELSNDDNFQKIAKPEMYDYFAEKTHKNGKPIFSWYVPDPDIDEGIKYGFFDEDVKGRLGLWTYRRIKSKANYKDEVKEVSLMNIPQNDFGFGNIYGDADSERNKWLAKQLSLSMVYWLQNYALDGKRGYPVSLCGEVMGTSDGVAKSPYIRESRRIKAVRTITENDVAKEFNNGIKEFEDSVGVGHYSIDVHSTTKTKHTWFSETYPFEIPLSAMIPIRVENLIPACKNIGTTHLTNGCYRLHPIEWNIGEVAGYLAAFCLDKVCTPKDVLTKYLKEFQNLIVNKGVQIHWDESKMW